MTKEAFNWMALSAFIVCASLAWGIAYGVVAGFGVFGIGCGLMGGTFGLALLR